MMGKPKMPRTVFQPDENYCSVYGIESFLVWYSEENCRLDHPAATIEEIPLDFIEQPIFADMGR